MQNVIELDLTSIKTLACLKVDNCKHLKRLSGSCTSLVVFEISQCPELEELSLGHLRCVERISILSCNHLKTVWEISGLMKVSRSEHSECCELQESSLSQLSCLETITIRNGE
ncbi:hypothetical protein SUGI_0687430 [Cryptomeria japonica]|nr:hypothetical protein SUGI_0687430 [Cryptomeria japonica]